MAWRASETVFRMARANDMAPRKPIFQLIEILILWIITWAIAKKLQTPSITGFDKNQFENKNFETI